jgi:plastocyanin
LSLDPDWKDSPMKQVAALIALALASVALVACGSSNSTTTTETSNGGEAGGGSAAENGEKSGGGGGGSTVEFEADPGGQLAYTTTEASAKAGEVTVDFKNPQGLTHDVAIEDSGGKTVGKTELIAESATSTTVNLKPGTYTYYCTVPGHREAGMEGTLTVK